VQAVFVFIASGVISSGISNMIGWLLVKNQVVRGECYFYGPVSSSEPFCTSPQALSGLLQILLMLAAWGLYVWMGLWSRGSVLQRIVWYALYGYGLIWLLVGVAQGIHTGAAVLYGVPDAWQDALNGYLPFIGVFVTGALIVTPYFFWLRRLAAQMPDRRQAIQQGFLALPAALSAGFFLVGVILLLQGALEQVVPGGSPIGADGWARAVGVLVAGLAYPFLWLAFRRDSDPARSGPMIPRRAYVLVILAATGIGAVIAAAVTAYQIAAIFLSLPFADALVARRAGVVLLVLGVMALSHLWQLRADQRAFHVRTPAEESTSAPAWTNATTVPSVLSALAADASAASASPAPPAAPVGNGAETLESILSAVAAGTLDPTTAAVRIRRLPGL
jgi:hypothetical protein